MGLPMVRSLRRVQWRNIIVSVPWPSNAICGCSALRRMRSGKAAAGALAGSRHSSPSSTASRTQRCWCSGTESGVGMRNPWSFPQLTPDSFHATQGRLRASTATAACAWKFGLDVSACTRESAPSLYERKTMS